MTPQEATAFAAYFIKFTEWAAFHYKQCGRRHIWKVRGSRSKDRYTTTELLTIYKNQL